MQKCEPVSTLPQVPRSTIEKRCLRRQERCATLQPDTSIPKVTVEHANFSASPTISRSGHQASNNKAEARALVPTPGHRYIITWSFPWTRKSRLDQYGTDALDAALQLRLHCLGLLSQLQAMKTASALATASIKLCGTHRTSCSTFTCSRRTSHQSTVVGQTVADVGRRGELGILLVLLSSRYSLAFDPSSAPRSPARSECPVATIERSRCNTLGPTPNCSTRDPHLHRTARSQAYQIPPSQASYN